MVVWACLCVGGASENFLLKTRYINSLFDWFFDWLIEFKPLMVSDDETDKACSTVPAERQRHRLCAAARRKLGMQPFSKSSRLLTMSCSHKNCMKRLTITHTPRHHWKQYHRRYALRWCLTSGVYVTRERQKRTTRTPRCTGMQHFSNSLWYNRLQIKSNLLASTKEQ